MKLQLANRLREARTSARTKSLSKGTPYLIDPELYNAANWHESITNIGTTGYFAHALPAKDGRPIKTSQLLRLLESTYKGGSAGQSIYLLTIITKDGNACRPVYEFSHKQKPPHPIGLVGHTTEWSTENIINTQTGLSKGHNFLDGCTPYDLGEPMGHHELFADFLVELNKCQRPGYEIRAAQNHGLTVTEKDGNVLLAVDEFSARLVMDEWVEVGS